MLFSTSISRKVGIRKHRQIRNQRTEKYKNSKFQLNLWQTFESISKI